MLRLIAGLVFLASSSLACADELFQVELDVSGICDNWVSFPTKTWVNNTGQAVRIKGFQGAFASAQSLLGEIAIWVSAGSKGGWPSGVIYRYGVESFSSPQQSKIDKTPLGGDWITIPAGDVLTATANCGPVNLPGGGQSAPMNYVGVVVVFYTLAPL